MKTRSKQTTKKAGSKGNAESQPKALPDSEASPPRVLILPANASPRSKIVSLNHPATSQPVRYFYCPETGFFEFMTIAAPRKRPSSWMITNGQEPSPNGNDDDTAYVSQNADLLVATPYDPVFFLLPVLHSLTTKSPQKNMFLSAEDYLELLESGSKTWKELLQDESTRKRVTAAMARICDVVDAGEEQMYRCSDQKILDLVVKRAKAIVENGIPASIEGRFVTQPLKVPSRRATVPSLQAQASAATEDPEKDSSAESQISTTATPSEPMDSQSSGASSQSANTPATSFASELPTPTESEPAPAPQPEIPAEIIHLQRIRVALDLLMRNIPERLRTLLNTQLSLPSSPIDFAQLTAHVAHVASIRADLEARLSFADNISRKRAFDADEEAADARAEKKRKEEETKKAKKSTETRAMKELRKVDTSGMMKLTGFFKKMPAKG